MKMNQRSPPALLKALTIIASVSSILRTVGKCTKDEQGCLDSDSAPALLQRNVRTNKFKSSSTSTDSGSADAKDQSAMKSKQASVCPLWCVRHNAEWSTKCFWAGCVQCSECIPSTPEPPPATKTPTTSPTATPPTVAPPTAAPPTAAPPTTPAPTPMTEMQTQTLVTQTANEGYQPSEIKHFPSLEIYELCGQCVDSWGNFDKKCNSLEAWEKCYNWREKYGANKCKDMCIERLTSFDGWRTLCNPWDNPAKTAFTPNCWGCSQCLTPQPESWTACGSATSTETTDDEPAAAVGVDDYALKYMPYGFKCDAEDTVSSWAVVASKDQNGPTMGGMSNDDRRAWIQWKRDTGRTDSKMYDVTPHECQVECDSQSWCRTVWYFPAWKTYRTDGSVKDEGVSDCKLEVGGVSQSSYNEVQSGPRTDAGSAEKNQHRVVYSRCFPYHSQCAATDPSPPPLPKVLSAEADLINTENTDAINGWDATTALVIKAKIIQAMENVHDTKVAVQDSLKGLGVPYECSMSIGAMSDTRDARAVHHEACDPFKGGTTGFTTAKLVRLGFHDCLRYSDGSGGCDGCLNFDGMFKRFYGQTNEIWPGTRGIGDNNDLAFTADVLELIYTDGTFPAYAQTLPCSGTGDEKVCQSPKDKGISRADLWAFAQLVGIEKAMEANDIKCAATSAWTAEAADKYEYPTDGSGSTNNLFSHNMLKALGLQCEIGKPSLRFKPGRKDCTPKSCAIRPYEAQKHERHPDIQFTGLELVTWFKNNFNPDFTARDVVAIMGAHSLGRVHPVAPLDAYSWTRTQDLLLNHQYYRNIVNKPELMLMGGQWNLEGDIGKEITEWGQYWLAGWGGQPHSPHWKPVKGLRMWGAPYHWTHVFEHGPVCYKEKGGEWTNRGFAVEEAQKSAGKAWKGLGDIKGGTTDKFKSDLCCEKLMNGKPWNVDKSCLTWTANDELMFSVDIGLYWEFNRTWYGRPVGCAGMLNHQNWREEDDEAWLCNDRLSMTGGGASMQQDVGCNRMSYTDDGDSRPMHEIVMAYADNQAEWVSDFISAIEKQHQTGYQPSVLKATGWSVFGEDVTCTTGVKRPAALATCSCKSPNCER